jgi:VRR-NUC domain
MSKREPKKITPEKLAASGTEQGHQTALFAWMADNLHLYPELRWAFHIPNGGIRDPITASRMRAMGLKAGVPDIFLPVTRRQKHGLFLEMKIERGKLSDNQNDWIDILRMYNYEVAVCYGWEAARDFLIEYLRG